MAAIYYRIIQNAVPTPDDFRTMEQLGQPLHNDAIYKEWAQGISVYNDRDFALNRARRNTTELGRYVVPMAIPEDSDIEVQQTTRNRRHYTIYANRERALALVCGPAIYAIEQGDD